MKPARSNWKYIAWFPCLALLAFMLAGCDEGAVVEPDTETSSAAEPSGTYVVDGKATKAGQEVNQDLRALSELVARALADETVRQKLHTHAMEKFDGETNVLWMNLKSGVKQAVLDAAQAGKTPELASMQAIETSVSRASEALGGNLHLYWAFAEKFDGSRAPLVAYVPVHIDADEVTTLAAFDAEGKEYRVNEEIARNRPVVVLNRNERTNAEGEVPYKICLPGETGSNCDPAPPPPPPPPDDPPGGGGGNEYAGFMRLDWIRMYDPYEGWPNGGPEFHMTLTKYDAGAENPVEIQGVRLWDKFDIDRSDCDGRKIELNHLIRDWNPEDFPTYSIQWVERDSPPADWLYKYWIYDVPFELPAWVEGVKAIVDHFIKKDSKDDILEHAITDYDDSPKYYGTGAPDFRLTLIEE